MNLWSTLKRIPLEDSLSTINKFSRVLKKKIPVRTEKKKTSLPIFDSSSFEVYAKFKDYIKQDYDVEISEYLNDDINLNSSKCILSIDDDTIIFFDISKKKSDQLVSIRNINENNLLLNFTDNSYKIKSDINNIICIREQLTYLIIKSHRLIYSIQCDFNIITPESDIIPYFIGSYLQIFFNNKSRSIFLYIANEIIDSFPATENNNNKNINNNNNRRYSYEHNKLKQKFFCFSRDRYLFCIIDNETKIFYNFIESSIKFDSILHNYKYDIMKRLNIEISINPKIYDFTEFSKILYLLTDNLRDKQIVLYNNN